MKKLFILIIICIFFLCPQNANAGVVSGGVDKAINGTAKAAYYVTKYTLKTGWFVVKKTAKGIKAVSKNIFNATKDAFNSNTKTKPVNSDYNNYNDSVLPPPPNVEF